MVRRRSGWNVTASRALYNFQRENDREDADGVRHRSTQGTAADSTTAGAKEKREKKKFNPNQSELTLPSSEGAAAQSDTVLNDEAEANATPINDKSDEEDGQVGQNVDADCSGQIIRRENPEETTNEEKNYHYVVILEGCEDNGSNSPTDIKEDELKLMQKTLEYQANNMMANSSKPKTLEFDGEYELAQSPRKKKKKVQYVNSYILGTRIVQEVSFYPEWVSKFNAGLEKIWWCLLNGMQDIALVLATLMTISFGSLLTSKCSGLAGQTICPLLFPDVVNATFQCLDQSRTMVTQFQTDYLYCKDLLMNYDDFDSDLWKEEGNLGKKTVKTLQRYLKPKYMEKLGEGVTKELKDSLAKVKAVQNCRNECVCKQRTFFKPETRVHCEVYIRHLEEVFLDKIPRRLKTIY